MSGPQPLGRPLLRVDAGIPAFNEEHRIGTAIASLVRQTLPIGVEWGTIWVVASGCTDATGSEARRATPKVVVVEEGSRRGKSAALQSIFTRTQADLLVLLNADAVALPGAISAMMAHARTLTPPYAVSARPVLPADFPRVGVALAVRLLWEVHTLYETRAFESGRSRHLDDELLLMPVSHLPRLEPGIVNDGPFIAGWILRSGGRIGYAAEAEVQIRAPTTWRDHVAQRRRIFNGDRQIREIFGEAPSAATGSAVRRPREILRVVRDACDRLGIRDPSPICRLLIAEIIARAQSTLDRRTPPSDLAIWPTLPG